MAKLLFQSVNENFPDQETKDVEKVRMRLYATEVYLTEMIWMARMLSDEGALSLSLSLSLSGFVYAALFVVLNNICRQRQLEIQLGRTGLDSVNLAFVFESKLHRQKPV